MNKFTLVHFVIPSVNFVVISLTTKDTKFALGTLSFYIEQIAIGALCDIHCELCGDFFNH